MYAKVFAMRLEKNIPYFVHHQIGFIKSQYASDNICRSLHVLDACSKSTDKNVILSLMLIRNLIG